MKLIESLRSKRSDTISLDSLLESFTYNGINYPLTVQQTQGQTTEEIGADFSGLIEGAYRKNGIVFSCLMVRQLLFQEARFQFRRLQSGRPGEYFGTRDLEPLETPAPNQTTGDLLARAIQDVDLAGNWYGVRVARPGGFGIGRLHPEYVYIILGSQMDSDHPGIAPDAIPVGYLYKPPNSEPRGFPPEQIAHFAPYPDPLANYRGMSWLTPVVREIMGDQAATTHKLKFFDQGAPQPLDAKVLTPQGWSTMGAMGVGDEVIGRDGRPHRVSAVYPQGERDIYRVTFSDGAKTECTADHVWRVATAYDRKRGVHRTLPLSEIVRNGLAYESGPLKWSVPYVRPVEYAPVDRPEIDPYVFGLLLGDGSFRGNGAGSGGVSLAMATEDADWTESHVMERVPAGVGASRRDRGGWSEIYFKGLGSPRANPMTEAVRRLGIYGTLGRDKWIPDEYLYASIEDRIALLQGIVDSDGHIDRVQGSATVTTTSERLASQIAELVGSLGGASTYSRNRNRSTIRVQVKRLPDWIVPCRLPRKVETYRAPRTLHRYIKSVEFVGRKQAQCIRVESSEHLYVTDDFVVTHNTPNMVISFDPDVSSEAVKDWIELMEQNIGGAANAYRTLYLAHGADAKVVGNSMKDIGFQAVQGAGETRIAAAAGVPPVIAGFSEGLQAATYANYSQARRRFADGTMRPLWRNIAGCLAGLIRVPRASELWYDDRDIPFLAEDVKDSAETQFQNAQAIKALTEAGYDPNSVVDAITAGDLNRLVHTGVFSVQLQAPGEQSQGELPPRSRAAPADANPPGEAQIRRLIAVYQETERKVQALLAEAVAGATERHLGAAMEALDALRREDPAEAIQAAYADAYDHATGMLMEENAATDPAGSLAESLTRKLDGAIEEAESRAPDAFRSATKDNLEDAKRQAVIGHVDDAGREWTLGSYADMTASTLGRRATSRGVVNAVGGGRVIVSSHGSTHPVCKELEGKSFPAQSAPQPPYHAGCQHMLIPSAG